MENGSYSDKQILFFTEKSQSNIFEIGGKGYSLHRMSNNGLNVPPGFILKVSFFEQWKKKIKGSTQWEKYIACIQYIILL